MAAIDQRTVGAKVNNQIADAFFEFAHSIGRTPSNVLAQYIEETVSGKTSENEGLTDLELLGISLIDAFLDNGFPEDEIYKVIHRIKAQITPYSKADWA